MSRSLYRNRVAGLAETLLYLALLGLFVICVLPDLHDRLVGLLVWCAAVVVALGGLLGYWLRQRYLARRRLVRQLAHESATAY